MTSTSTTATAAHADATSRSIRSTSIGWTTTPGARTCSSTSSRLVKLRTRADALAVNDTEFLHVDFNDGKRVVVWRRGRDGIDDPVVVVANFSDLGPPIR